MRTKTHPGLFVLEFVINPSVSACLLLTLLPISSVLLRVTASSSQVLQRGSEAYNLPATVDKGTLRSSFRSQVCVLKWQDRANWDTLDSRNISIAANLHIVQGGPGCVPTAGQVPAQGTMADVCSFFMEVDGALSPEHCPEKAAGSTTQMRSRGESHVQHTQSAI